MWKMTQLKVSVEITAKWWILHINRVSIKPQNMLCKMFCTYSLDADVLHSKSFIAVYIIVHILVEASICIKSFYLRLVILNPEL